MKRILLFTLTTLLMLGTFAGCGNSKEEPSGSSDPSGDSGKAYHFSFICPNIGLSYWSDVRAGLEQADAEFGTTTDFVGPQKIDTMQQIQMMESAIASKADGIIVAALDGTAFEPIINKAVDAGIPVICLDADSPTSKRASFIGTENTAAGQAEGEALAKIMNGKANVGIITGALDSDNVNQRIDGIKKAFEAYPDMKIVDIQTANTDLLQATEKTQTMLQAHPEINAMLGTTSNDMIGAAQIIKEKGLSGKITLINFDDLDQTLALIRSGDIYATVAQRPVQGGYLSVKNMIDLVEGKEIPDRIDTGITIVTKDNVDTYKNN